MGTKGWDYQQLVNWTDLVVLTLQLLISQRQACKLQAVTRFYRRICRREQREGEIAAVSASQLHTGTNDTTVGAILDQHTETETRALQLFNVSGIIPVGLHK